MDLAIGGIEIAALIFGIVEVAKEFGVQGKKSRVLALILGFFFTGLAYGANQGLFSELWMSWILWIVTALAGALAAMGYYDFLKKRVLRQ